MERRPYRHGGLNGTNTQDIAPRKHGEIRNAVVAAARLELCGEVVGPVLLTRLPAVDDEIPERAFSDLPEQRIKMPVELRVDAAAS